MFDKNRLESMQEYYNNGTFRDREGTEESKKTWRVVLCKTKSYHIDILADNMEEAEEQAYEMYIKEGVRPFIKYADDDIDICDVFKI